MGWGGWRGNPDDRPPPPFREGVAEPIRAGDLTCSSDARIHSCATVSELHRLRRWLTVFDVFYATRLVKSMTGCVTYGHKAEPTSQGMRVSVKYCHHAHKR